MVEQQPEIIVVEDDMVGVTKITSPVATIAAGNGNGNGNGKENKENLDPVTVTKPEEMSKKKKTKEERDAEKSQREKERLEKKRQRDEEKQQKENERLAKKQKLEEEKLQKEAEKEKKRLEKEKEEEDKKRAQPTLGAFFKKSIKKKETPAVEDGMSDFERVFKPFEAKAGVTLYKGFLYDQFEQSSQSLSEWMASHKKNRGRTPGRTATSIMEDMSVASGGQDWDGLIGELPTRYLHFGEDKRPPFIGTWSKPARPGLNQSPFTRLDNVDYDYDSEAEYLDLNMGDDLENDDVMSIDESLASDEDDFLVNDDNDAIEKNAAFAASDPVVKVNNGDDRLFDLYTAQVCLTITGPIDPHYDYWSKTPQTSTALSSSSPKTKANGNSEKLIEKLSKEQVRQIVNQAQGRDDPNFIVIHNIHDELKLQKNIVKAVLDYCMIKVDQKNDQGKKVKRYEPDASSLEKALALCSNKVIT